MLFGSRHSIPRAAGVLFGAALVANGLSATSMAAAVDSSKGSPGFCPTGVGVTVVVDFQQLGGQTIVRCFPNAAPGTGLDALKGAGFQIEGVRRWGEAFICRIENRPSPTEALQLSDKPTYHESCVDTPPAKAYWSYWWAGNNCAWTYSQWGVKNRQFVEGGFEGWSFSLNATADSNPEPRIAPVRPGTQGQACTTADEPAPVSNNPDEKAPVRITTQTVAPGTEPSNDASRSTAPDAIASNASALPPPVPRTNAAPTLRDPSHNASYTGGQDSPDITKHTGTSKWAPWVGAAAILALTVSAGLTARRRRHARGHD